MGQHHIEPLPIQSFDTVLLIQGPVSPPFCLRLSVQSVLVLLYIFNTSYRSACRPGLFSSTTPGGLYRAIKPSLLSDIYLTGPT
jgi:hypothetical protein